MPLEVQIEAVLFYKTEPLSKKELVSFFAVSEADVTEAIITLSLRLNQGATRIIELDDTVQMVTAPELSETIERLRKEELTREIGKAGAETLAIILYRGPVTRAEIDHIRGVNSSFILRNLQIRGLIERIAHPTLARSFQYTASLSLLSHLGVTKREELPEYADIMQEIDRFEKESHRENDETSSASDAQVHSDNTV